MSVERQNKSSSPSRRFDIAEHSARPDLMPSHPVVRTSLLLLVTEEILASSLSKKPPPRVLSRAPEGHALMSAEAAQATRATVRMEAETRMVVVVVWWGILGYGGSGIEGVKVR